MSDTRISAALRQQISERDRHLCSYCRTAEKVVGGELTIDHIIPESLGGPTEIHNLCLVCWNLIKGNRIIGSAPLTAQLERFYHPVEQQCHEHFTWIDNDLIAQEFNSDL